jgi:hypothetical protein
LSINNTNAGDTDLHINQAGKKLPAVLAALGGLANVMTSEGLIVLKLQAATVT